MSSLRRGRQDELFGMSCWEELLIARVVWEELVHVNSRSSSL